MEFDSEEEREIFGNTEEDEEEIEIESEYSSAQEEDKTKYLDDVTAGECNKLLEARCKQEGGQLPLSKTSSSNTLTSSKSTTPSDLINDEFFSENGTNFTDELVNNASNLITTPTLDDNKSRDSSSSSSSSSEEEESGLLTPSIDENTELHVQQGGKIPADSSPPIDRATTAGTLLCSEKIASSSEEVILMTSHLDEKVTTKTYYKNRANVTLNRSIAKKHRRRCGECSACLIEFDCGACRFCKDMRKYGGPGKLRQKCITRQCIKLSRVLYTEDPLISRGETRMQEEMKTELERVSGTLPKLETGLNTLSLPKSLPNAASIIAQSLAEQKTQQQPSLQPAPPPKVIKRPPPLKKPQNKKTTNSHPTSRKRPIKRQRVYNIINESDSDEEMYSKASRRRPLSSIHRGWGRIDKGGSGQQQCDGPECVYAARPSSKYCSEECGVQLALRRIETFLPKQKKLWEESDEPLASKDNREKIREFEKEQEVISEQLKVLDQQTSLIEEHVARMKNVSPHHSTDESDECDDITIHCATCSQTIGLKKAQVHMARCFTRLEGMVSFGSIVKNEGTDIFCDKYNRSQGTYCKRLRVLCPEHTKEPKTGPHDVCGCPMEADFPLKLSESKKSCRNLKKSCLKHYSWEKLRRAEIDQEKLNLFLKQEEFNEQSRLINWQLNYRGSLLPVMLHHTIDHINNDT